MAKKRRKVKYVFTPARRNALAKARAVKSAKVHGRRKELAHVYRKIYSSDLAKRGIGIPGAKKNFIPYARVSQRSATGGFNVGTVIPGTGRRVVAGAYARLENVKRSGIITQALDRAASKGSSLGKARKYFNENVTITNPALRANIRGSQVRLGTSRHAGPTLTIRRGRHKTPQKVSKQGIKEYDLRMKKIESKQLKPARRQRRRRRGS